MSERPRLSNKVSDRRHPPSKNRPFPSVWHKRRIDWKWKLMSNYPTNLQLLMSAFLMLSKWIPIPTYSINLSKHDTCLSSLLFHSAQWESCRLHFAFRRDFKQITPTSELLPEDLTKIQFDSNHNQNTAAAVEGVYLFIHKDRLYYECASYFLPH